MEADYLPASPAAQPSVSVSPDCSALAIAAESAFEMLTPVPVQAGCQWELAMCHPRELRQSGSERQVRHPHHRLHYST